MATEYWHMTSTTRICKFCSIWQCPESLRAMKHSPVYYYTDKLSLDRNVSRDHSMTMGVRKTNVIASPPTKNPLNESVFSHSSCCINEGKPHKRPNHRLPQLPVYSTASGRVVDDQDAIQLEGRKLSDDKMPTADTIRCLALRSLQITCSCVFYDS